MHTILSNKLNKTSSINNNKLKLTNNKRSRRTDSSPNNKSIIYS